MTPYILHSRHTLASPASRAKLARVLRSTGRGYTQMHFLHGLGATPTQPVTDQQYNASADAPGTNAYMRVDVLQCALNSWMRVYPSGLAPLAVDGRWGSRTSAALVAFVHAIRSVPPPPPASIDDYHYITPPAGATVVQVTNALSDALTADNDTTRCVVDAATGRSVPTRPATTTALPTTHAPVLAPSQSSFDWTTWGIAAAGAVALGAVGFAIFKKRGRKKGRR